MNRRFAPASALVLILLSAARAAQAQPAPVAATGFAASRFEPSERGSDWFAAESLDLRGHARPAIGIVGDYATRPLAIYGSSGEVRSEPVANDLRFHLGASFVLWERLRLAASLPLQAYTGGGTGTLNGVAYAAPPHEQSLGDVRLSADVRLAGTYGDPITVALGASVFLPTGSTAQYTSDGAVRLLPRVMVAGDIGAFTYAARAGFIYHARQELFASSPIGNEIPLSVAAGLRLADRRLTVGPEVYGSTSTDDPFKTRTTPLEGIFGAHYLIAGGVRVGGGIGGGLTRGYGAPQMRALLAIEWQPEVSLDEDGDGILDKDDACRQTRGVASAEPANNGCPEVATPEPADRDHDGVEDGKDACVDVPGITTEDPKTNGCPDADGDGIVDSADACHAVKGPANPDPKLNGCPDGDGDGITDAVDACSAVAGLHTDDPKTNGCPDPDRDKDGVANEVDACPDAPGKPDKDPKRNGCPQAFVEGNTIRILDQVKFKSGSAEILPGKDSEGVLKAVATVLGEHPEIKKIRIEGHTDNRGAAAFNKKLSADRAASVVKWLVKNGVAADRLTSAGFGQERPLDSNETEEGRKNNRRVEFHIEGSDAAAPGEEKK